MTLGQKIKHIRTTFELSQEELAEKLNVSRQVITKWEGDRGIPEVTNLKVLAELFDVSVDFLLDDTKQIKYPILKEKIKMKEKNNYSNRYDYIIDYLKKYYQDKAKIYALTEVGKDYSLPASVINFITLGIPFITNWINEPTIWFLIEKKNCNLIVKATKETLEIRELSSVIDTNKFSIDKTKLIKITNKL